MLVRDVLTRAGGLPLLAGLALVVTTFGPARPAHAQHSDAVQKLDRALSELPPPTDPDDKEAVAKSLKDRKDRLTALTDEKSQLTDLGDIAEALLLTTWGDEQRLLSDLLPGISEVDSEVRKALLNRFVTGAKNTIQAGTERRDASLREAVAGLMGEFATSARSSTLGTRAGNRLLIDGLPTISAVIANLAKTDKSPEVRAGAARALAKLRADPDVTMGAFTSLLKDSDPAVRRAAATALSGAGATAGVLRGSAPAGPGGIVVTVEPPTRDEIIAFGKLIAPATGAVLARGDPDPEVRRHCAEALAALAQILTSQVQVRPTDLPAESRTALRPVITALRDQTAALSTATHDPDAGVRHAALRALEMMGEVRRRRLHPEDFRGPEKVLPPREGQPAKPPKADAASVEEAGGFSLTVAVEQAAQDKDAPLALKAAVPALVRALGSPDVRTRLGAVEALEMVAAHGTDRTAAPELDKQQAAEVAKGLTRSLYDRDRFVRWAAARTLGRMAPLDDAENGKQVLQGAVIGLARLLSDGDPDVRLRVAYALERFGKAAGDAVPALAVAASRGDEEARIAAAHAIQVIGGNPGAAVPALAAGLDSTNVRLRRVAAEGLTTYGREARAAQPALQQALRDPDPEVRRLASSALIRIGTGK
jgi:HEAT repeat protein